SEPLRRVVAAAEAAVAVRRHEAERGDAGTRHALDHHLRRERREPPQAALLPGGDERAHRAFVGHRRARRAEGEPAPGALEAPLNRPRGRRAAAGAEGRAEPRQPVRAGAAEDRSSGSAAETALREQDIEHKPKLPAGRRLLGAGFAPTLPRFRDRVGVLELVVVADIEPLALEAVAVDRLAGLEPCHEAARLIRRVTLLEVARDEAQV